MAQTVAVLGLFVVYCFAVRNLVSCADRDFLINETFVGRYAASDRGNFANRWEDSNTAWLPPISLEDPRFLLERSSIPGSTYRNEVAAKSFSSPMVVGTAGAAGGVALMGVVLGLLHCCPRKPKAQRTPVYDVSTGQHKKPQGTATGQRNSVQNEVLVEPDDSYV